MEWEERCTQGQDEADGEVESGRAEPRGDAQARDLRLGFLQAHVGPLLEEPASVPEAACSDAVTVKVTVELALTVPVTVAATLAAGMLVTVTSPCTGSCCGVWIQKGRLGHAARQPGVQEEEHRRGVEAGSGVDGTEEFPEQEPEESVAPRVLHSLESAVAADAGEGEEDDGGWA